MRKQRWYFKETTVALCKLLNKQKLLQWLRPKLFAPIVWALTASTNGILRLCGIDPNAEEDQVSEEEIRMMVDVGNQKGVIDSEEKEMIQNVFEFDDPVSYTHLKHLKLML